MADDNTVENVSRELGYDEGMMADIDSATLSQAMKITDALLNPIASKHLSGEDFPSVQRLQLSMISGSFTHRISAGVISAVICFPLAASARNGIPVVHVYERNAAGVCTVATNYPVGPALNSSYNSVATLSSLVHVRNDSSVNTASGTIHGGLVSDSLKRIALLTPTDLSAICQEQTRSTRATEDGITILNASDGMGQNQYALEKIVNSSYTWASVNARTVTTNFNIVDSASRPSTGYPVPLAFNWGTFLSNTATDVTTVLWVSTGGKLPLPVNECYTIVVEGMLNFTFISLPRIRIYCEALDDAGGVVATGEINPGNTTLGASMIGGDVPVSLHMSSGSTGPSLGSLASVTFKLITLAGISTADTMALTSAVLNISFLTTEADTPNDAMSIVIVEGIGQDAIISVEAGGALTCALNATTATTMGNRRGKNKSRQVYNTAVISSVLSNHAIAYSDVYLTSEYVSMVSTSSRYRDVGRAFSFKKMKKLYSMVKSKAGLLATGARIAGQLGVPGMNLAATALQQIGKK